MRKKIFLIHGTGVRQGLGKESGGDLDTVSANTFYGIWMEQLVSNELDGNPEYGEDYEFDFINYQEGLRHLDVHQGCDLYLPDFPIDALSPRLQMRRLRRQEAAGERSKLYKAVKQIRTAFNQRPDLYSDSWKEIYNTLNKQSGKYLNEKKFYEIKIARLYSELLFGLVRQLFNEGSSSVTERITNYLFGQEFVNFRDDLRDKMDSDIKRDIIDDIDQQYVERRLLLNDSAGSDYGRMFKMRDGEHLLSAIVESLSTVTGTYFLLPEIKGVTSDESKDELMSWCEDLTGMVSDYFEKLNSLLAKIRDANPDHKNMTLMHERGKTLQKFFSDFDYSFTQSDYNPRPDLFHVHITEESTGRPVDDLEVVFNVSEGPIKITPVTHQSTEQADNIALRTNENGYAAVQLIGIEQAETYGVTATYDDINLLSFPKNLKLGEDYFDEHPDPDSIELQLLDYIGEDSGNDTVESRSGNTDQIEEGTDTPGDRAVRVQTQMMERHIRYLDDNDVSLIRIDDHHPYTPEMLETLKSLRDEGLIESITLSSLPRGEHQDKEDQLCGADLIYKQFIEGTEADNKGLEALCNATHLQDLHIEEDYMAIELSKLIGSKFSKVDMAKGLMEINSEDDYDSILQDTGWNKEISKYEKGLQKVLPRVDLTLFKMTFSLPPESGSYEDEVGWNFFQFPFQYYFANDSLKKHLLREKHLEDSDNEVTIFCALSPFCDPDEGEPQINVASAQNYLTDLYDFDYFFYAYGSMLMSTRRVNPDGFDIDLSKLVSKVGSPSDGGHPGAATGSPESNPNFPVERFESVGDKNFAEYIHYISSYVEDFTGLELHSLEELYPTQFEKGVRDKLSELEEDVYELGLSGEAGVAKILFTNAVYTDDDEGDITVPLACSHIKKQFSDVNYIFYSVSSSNLVMRNVGDERLTLDLGKIASTLGTYRDGGHQRAATCKPRFNPSFPEDDLDYINSSSLPNYADYICNKIIENFDFREKNIAKVNPI